jgi:hypothetical protein
VRRLLKSTCYQCSQYAIQQVLCRCTTLVGGGPEDAIDSGAAWWDGRQLGPRSSLGSGVRRVAVGAEYAQISAAVLSPVVADALGRAETVVPRVRLAQYVQG